MIKFNDQDIVDYLKTNWDEIDAVRLPLSPDGRLPKEKIFLKYVEMLSKGQLEDTVMLEAIFERYDEICQCYEDAYFRSEESLLGISEEDVSVYQQKISGADVHRIKPRRWRTPVAEAFGEEQFMMTG